MTVWIQDIIYMCSYDMGGNEGKHFADVKITHFTVLQKWST